MEMKRFSQEFFPGVPDDTFLAEVGLLSCCELYRLRGTQSCGVADLITTCKVSLAERPGSSSEPGIGGRNRRVAEAFVKTKKVCRLSVASIPRQWIPSPSLNWRKRCSTDKSCKALKRRKRSTSFSRPKGGWLATRSSTPLMRSRSMATPLKRSRT